MASRRQRALVLTPYSLNRLPDLVIIVDTGLNSLLSSVCWLKLVRGVRGYKEVVVDLMPWGLAKEAFRRYRGSGVSALAFLAPCASFSFFFSRLLVGVGRPERASPDLLGGCCGRYKAYFIAKGRSEIAIRELPVLEVLPFGLAVGGPPGNGLRDVSDRLEEVARPGEVVDCLGHPLFLRN